MNGTNHSGTAWLTATNGPNWLCEGAADFDSDCKPDVLWRNQVTGSNIFWKMDGTSYVASVALPPLSNQSWQIVATADFDGDGVADLLWRNSVDGEVKIWTLTTNHTLKSEIFLPQMTDLNWNVQGSVDFDGNRTPDILWRYYGQGTNQGRNLAWLMNGTTYTNTNMEWSAQSNLNWAIGAVGVGNFAGGSSTNGRPYLVWRDSTTGSNVMWVLNGSTVISTNSLDSVTNLNFSIVAPK